LERGGERPIGAETLQTEISIVQKIWGLMIDWLPITTNRLMCFISWNQFLFFLVYDHADDLMGCMAVEEAAAEPSPKRFRVSGKARPEALFRQR